MSTRALDNTRLAAGKPPRAAANRWSDRPWWLWVKRALTLAFFALVVTLLWRYALTVHWKDVWSAIRQTPGPALLAAIGLAVSSHLLYSCFDLLGRRYTGHGLPTLLVMTMNFISYAFNLTLGSLVGGVAFRYRLYSQAGLAKGVITRIVSMSMLTNWLGYMLLAGLLFLFLPMTLPPSWKMGNQGLQWIGMLLVAIAGGYVVACMRLGGRSWVVRGHEIDLPHLRMALLQMVMSCTNWMLMAGIIYVLLQLKVAYTDVLTVLLVAAIAGVMAHVPAGLGVFEFVFVALLSHKLPEAQLLAALLGYRALYYITPTLIAAALYVAFEVRAKNGTLPGASSKRAG